MTRSRRIALPLLAAAGVGACMDAPTEPKAAAPVETAATVSADAVPGLSLAVEDARLRVIPALGGSPSARALGGAFERLQRALFTGDEAAAATASADARAALATLAEEQPAAAVDLASVALVLEARAVQSGTARRAEP